MLTKSGMLILVLLSLAIAILLVLALFLFSPPSFDSYKAIYFIRQIVAAFTNNVLGPILKFLDTYWSYLPLAAIGIWRWGVWLIKKTCALFYRPISLEIDTHYSTLTIVTPVY